MSFQDNSGTNSRKAWSAWTGNSDQESSIGSTRHRLLLQLRYTRAVNYNISTSINNRFCCTYIDFSQSQNSINQQSRTRLHELTILDQQQSINDFVAYILMLGYQFKSIHRLIIGFCRRHAYVS